MRKSVLGVWAVVGLMMAACGTPRRAASLPVPAGLEREDRRVLQTLALIESWCLKAQDCSEHEEPGLFGPRPPASPATVQFVEQQKSIARGWGSEIVYVSGTGHYRTRVVDDWLTLVNGYSPAPGDMSLNLIHDRMFARPGLYLGVFVEEIVGAAPTAEYLGQLRVCAWVMRFERAAPAAFRKAAELLVPRMHCALQRVDASPPPATHDVPGIKSCIELLQGSGK